MGASHGSNRHVHPLLGHGAGRPADLYRIVLPGRGACILPLLRLCGAAGQDLLPEPLLFRNDLLFLLILVPANRYCSIDILRKPSLKVTQTPAWTILLFKYQLCIVYCCAGLSKITRDWLIDAMPLRIWLPARSSIPLIGPLLRYEWTAYFFSWAGGLFDLSIVFLLLARPTRRIGYVLVIVFHVLTAVLFQIGMFPWLMMSATIVFFSEDFHVGLIRKARALFVGGGAANKHESRDRSLPAESPV